MRIDQTFGNVFENSGQVNGKLAVDYMAQCKPGFIDLVPMDIMMPVMDGYAATRAIRALNDPAIANVPIIAMTANAFDEDMRSAMKSRMNRNMPSPRGGKPWLGFTVT